MRLILLFTLAFFHVVNSLAQQKDTITTKSGIKYISLKPGSGETPFDGQKVTVYYRKGTLLNGKEFDTDISNRTIKFTIGANEVIPGWDEGFRLMKKGERGVLILPSRLAYGSEGVKDLDDESKYMIPPNSDLIFEVELMNIK